MRHGALVAFVSVAAISCAPVKRADTRPQLVIDLTNHRASTPQWQSEILDCSDAAFECIEAPGHFLMALPRACPANAEDWTVAGFRFRGTAPLPHFAPPSGGFVSYKYPYAHLVYQSGLGFTGLWVTSRPVVSENWGNPSVIEYDVRYADGRSRFLCKGD